MFNANLNCVIFGVNESLNKRCILSTDNSDFMLPKIKLEYSFLDSINEKLIKFLNEYILVNPLELMPQLINIHHKSLETDSETLEIVYGFIVDYNSSINSEKAYWIDFDPVKEYKLSHLFFETIQKLS